MSAVAYDDVASTRARPAALRVVMVGPGLNVRGGISNGQRLLIDALPKEVTVEHVASMVEGSKWRKLLTFLRALREIRKRVRGGEIVHIHFASGASSRRKMIIARLALRRGARVIMHARGGGYREYWQAMSRAERQFTLETLLRIQCLVVLGEGWRQFYESIGVPRNRIVIQRTAIGHILCPRLAVIHHVAPAKILADLGLVIKGRNRQLAEILPLGQIIRPDGVHPLAAATALHHHLAQDAGGWSLRGWFGRVHPAAS